MSIACHLGMVAAIIHGFLSCYLSFFVCLCEGIWENSKTKSLVSFSSMLLFQFFSKRLNLTLVSYLMSLVLQQTHIMVADKYGISPLFYFVFYYVLKF